MPVQISAGAWAVPIVVGSMVQVAQTPAAWAAYMGLTLAQRDLFRAALGGMATTTLAAIRAAAPAPVVAVAMPAAAAAMPAAAAAAPTPYPQSIAAHTGTAAAFYNWLHAQAALVHANAGLDFVLGARYRLGDGTISVPISISRNGAAVAHTSFVFHYHPGAAGAGVGHGYASVNHFKPADGSAKHIRVEQHQFVHIAGTLCADARAIARGR